MPESPVADGLLTGLVERYSPSGHERSAATYLADRMTALGFQANVDGAGNAVGTLGDGPRTLLLLGHIDTVPGYISVRREDRLLYGRGTVDAKGPLAAFTVAAAAAAAAGSLEGKRIVVVGAVEEEAATSKGARHLLPSLAPEVVVIGEPSGWNSVTVGYKGRLLVDYELHRHMGHTAGPDRSVCAEAFDFWAAIQAHAAAYNAEQQRVFRQLSPSLRSMASASDGFTETARLTIGFRMPPDIEAGALRRRVTELAGDADVHFRGQEPAHHARKSSSLARAFVRAIDAEGSRVQFKVKSGTSDMNVVAPVWQCPIVAYGPGDSRLDHTPQEHIDLDEYRRAIAVLTRVLKQV